MSVAARFVALLLVLIAALGATHSARAQSYPEPVHSCVIVPSSPTPGFNETVTLSIFVRDTAGQPAAGIAMTAALELQSFSQLEAVPGWQTGSVSPTLGPNSFTSGPDGNASLLLTTGDRPGLIRVTIESVTAGQEVGTGCQIQLFNYAIKPPQSGSGGVLDNESGTSWGSLWPLLIGALGSVAVTLAWRTREHC